MSTTLELKLDRMEARQTRMEKMLREALRPGVIGKPLKMKEKEVCETYNVSKSRLKQLRLGYTNKDIHYPPALFKWTHINGRKLEYDVKELDQVFKRHEQFKS